MGYRGSIFLAIYLVVSTGIGQVIYGGAEGAGRGLGAGIVALLFAWVICFIWKKLRQRPAPFAVLLILATIINIFTIASRVAETSAIHSVGTELAGVSQENLFPAMLELQGSPQALFFSETARIALDLQQKVQTAFGRVMHSSYTQLSDASIMGSSQARQLMLNQLSLSLLNLPGLIPEIEQHLDAVMPQVRAIQRTGLSPSDRDRFTRQFERGFTLSRGRSLAMAATIGAYVSKAQELYAFLEYTGQPTLGTDGRIYFETTPLLERFNVLAGEFDIAADILRTAIATNETAQREATDALRRQ